MPWIENFDGTTIDAHKRCINVESFRGLGKTDDVVIDEAIAFAIANGYGVVDFGDSEYTITATHTIASLASNKSLELVGHNALFHTPNSTSVKVFNITTTGNIVIRGIKFQIDNIGSVVEKQRPDCITVGTSANVTVVDCDFTNYKYAVINVDSSSATNGTGRVTIKDCTIHCYLKLYDAIVHGCYFKVKGGSPISITRCVFVGNRIDCTSASGVTNANCVCTGNILKGTINFATTTPNEVSGNLKIS